MFTHKPPSRLSRRARIVGLMSLALAAASAAPLATSTEASAAASASFAHACATPAPDWASCGAIQLLDPTTNWSPGLADHKGSGASSSSSLPSAGYLPGDLLNVYGLASAATAFGPGPSAPTIAIVDAYNDPYAAQDLATYRSSLSGSSVTDSQTGIADVSIPPLCSSTTITGCVTFTQVNQSGSTSLPRSDKGWAEEISLDLDMASAICPNCNITLVEASSASFANLQAAVTYAKSLTPAVITNSYGGNEFSSEISFNSTYAATGSTAITVSSGDSGYGTEYPAAAPNVTAVGGTSLTGSLGTSGWTWSPQTVWSGAGSGCSAYEPLPSWQNDQGVYNLSSTCNGRQVADVSAVADPNTGVAVYDTYGLSGWAVFGGTSVSAQIVGAIYALAAGSGNTVSTASSALYVDSGTSGGATPGLTPVATGTNGNCGSTYLCDAAASLSSGYNGPTGLGTFNGLSALTGSTSTSGGGTTSPDFSISASPSNESVTAGSSTPYTITLTSSGGYSGTVDLTAVVSGSSAGVTASFASNSVSLGSGTATTTMTVTTSTTSAGNYTITATGTDPSTSSLTHSTLVTLSVSSTVLPSMTVSVSAGTPVHHGSYRVPLAVTATGSSGGISGASVTLTVYQSSCTTGSPVTTSTGTTSSTGIANFNFTTKQTGTWCASATVTASGYNPGSGSTTFTSP